MSPYLSRLYRMATRRPVAVCITTVLWAWLWIAIASMHGRRQATLLKAAIMGRASAMLACFRGTDNSWLCLSCVFFGVSTTWLLPSSLLLNQLPFDAVLPLPAAIPISFIVYAVRARAEWEQAKGDGLAAKMLRAMAEGAVWTACLRSL